MAKNYSKKRLKSVFVAFALSASFSLTGLAAACAPEETTPPDNDKTTSREDTQLLRNGNFEFFNVPEKSKNGNEPVYLISDPDSWTSGGTSSYTKSGIIGTSEKHWEKISDPSLSGTLDYNNGLDSSASNYESLYVDYNNMKSSDILYKDTWAALNENSIDDWEEYFGIEKRGDDYYMGDKRVYIKTEGTGDDEKNTFYFDEACTHSVAKEVISNPGTHYNVQKDDNGLYYQDGDNRVTVYEDEKGDYYLEKDGDSYSKPISHVLMLHNYATSHNGIASNYSSISVDLPANTAAEISFWVKTADLLFDEGTAVSQDRGANVYVTNTVGGAALDDFAITCINTEKLIGEGKASEAHNGWVQYTVYVNSCDFASSTVSLRLGLGDTDYTVEGYAFFDDVTVTKYSNLGADGCTYDEQTVGNAQWKLSESDDSEKVFKADSYVRNEGIAGEEETDARYSDNFHYLLDLASRGDYEKVLFAQNFKAGLTVDADDYASAISLAAKTLNVTAEQPGNVKLPDALKNLKDANGDTGRGIDTSEDLLACVSTDFLTEGGKFNASHTSYFENLNAALADVDKLPGNSFAAADNNVLVMLSAKGAAYTASFEVALESEYSIISFWVKTSDMGGSTAATAAVYENGDRDGRVNVNLDSTGVTTDIDDETKDIYNGWVQCFFFVHNENADEADNHATTVTVEFSFGNTAINGTAVTSYKAGWVALANMQTLSVDDNVFSYTGNTSHSAALNITEDETPTANGFDEVRGNQSNQVSQNIVDAMNYDGVNGHSSSVVNNGDKSFPYDDKNTNPYAGLINKDYAANYADKDWYKTLIGNFGIDVDSPNYSDTDAVANWTEVFGAKSVQPLVLINKVRDGYVVTKEANADNFKSYFIKNDDDEFERVADDAEFDENETYYAFTRVMNYGFIGRSRTVSADSYATVSVKVKVSAGAVAYLYLVDTSPDKKVLSFTTPYYTFWYDEVGNVLKAKPENDATLDEKKANILYTLRDDGLYQDGDGNLYANTYNLKKIYTNEQVEYFDGEGNPVSFDNLVEGETYYSDAQHNNIANHFLANTDGVKIYEYKDGNYYYIVEGKTQNDVVHPFDAQYARYSTLSEDYSFALDSRYDANGLFITDEGHGALGYDKSGNFVADEWFTVNFIIHAGSSAKSYRLELWSGERESRGVEIDANGDVTSTLSQTDSAVLFDYSYSSISDNSLTDFYENEIIRGYQELLADNGLLSSIPTSNENIAYYERIAAENELGSTDGEGYADVNGLKYRAHYLTYSLYDSESFRPFNKDVALDNATGYDYSADDYSEALAFLQIKDGNDYTLFTDYSTVERSITLDSGSEEEEEPDEDDNEDNSSVWLLASSILLVIALLFAMIAILVRDTLKKIRRKNAYGASNSANLNKAARYRRKLGIKKEVYEEEPEDTLPEETLPEETLPEAEEPVAEPENSDGGDSENQ